MKKLIAFVILYSSFAILCPGAKAQWDGAEVQRLTYNDVPDIGQEHKFYIDDNDNLHLFYLEGIRDSATGFIYSYRLMSTTKEKGEEWNQPEEIGNPAGMGWGDMEVGYDIKGGITHIAYARFLSLAYDTMYYTNSEMPDWQLVKIDSLSNVYGARYDWLKMTFDTLCNVHLMWHVDYGSTGVYWYKLMYANNSTGEWVKQQISPSVFLGGMGSGASYLAVQKDGSVHIVYHGDVGGPDIPYYYIRNDSLNSEDWHRDTIPRPSRPIYNYGGGPLKIDANDMVHLLTWGCIQPGYCIEPGLHRTFYYYKEDQDSIWQGGDLILDSLFYPAELFIDSESTPYLLEWDPSTYCWFFTDRKQGFWREPYQILDSVSLCNDPSSIYPQDFSFVLDSEGRGHGVFSGSMFLFMGQDDSLEIFYYGAPFTSVEDTLEDQGKFSFELFQNYPNPFNQTTVIRYSLNTARPIHTTLRLYNILGKEVRELVNRTQSTGYHQVYWDGKNNSGKEVASGIYFYVLRAGERRKEQKMLLMK